MLYCSRLAQATGPTPPPKYKPRQGRRCMRLTTKNIFCHDLYLKNKNQSLLLNAFTLERGLRDCSGPTPPGCDLFVPLHRWLAPTGYSTEHLRRSFRKEWNPTKNFRHLWFPEFFHITTNRQVFNAIALTVKTVNLSELATSKFLTGHFGILLLTFCPVVRKSLL